jgi:hypothetical protein
MGKVRECFKCSRLLAPTERHVAEATTSGAGGKIVEVCDRCHVEVARAGAIAMGREGLTVVLRPQPVQAELFPAASRTPTPTDGRDG